MLWEEDPITRKVLRGRRTFQWVYMLKFWSVWLPNTFVEKELKKKVGKNNKNAICNLQLSLLVLITTVQHNYHNYQLMAINHKTKWSAIIAMITNTCTDCTCLHHHCLVCPQYQDFPIKVVYRYMVLRFFFLSARKIVGTRTTLCTSAEYRKHYGTRMICLVGFSCCYSYSSLHVQSPFNDFVTNSYGESWDLSCEKS